MNKKRSEEMDKLMHIPPPQMYFKDYVKFAEAYKSLSPTQAAALRVLSKIALKYLAVALPLLTPDIKRNAEEAIAVLLSNYDKELQQDEWIDVLHTLMGQQVALEEDRGQT